MYRKLKYCLVVFITVLANSLFAQTENHDKDFRRFHFTVEAGFNKTSIDEVVTDAFAKELYEGTINLLDDYLRIGGNPENVSGSDPVLNLALDVSVNKRLKFGIGINGIPETHIIGYINKDSLLTDTNYAGQLYDQAEEIVKGTTLKAEMLFAIKPYQNQTAIGWELNLGAGLTCNFVKIKQNYLLQSVDTVTQEIISDYYHSTDNKSSVGAFLVCRLNVHLTRGFSITGDFNWMFDTGLKVDETHFNFYNTRQQIDSHHLKFNSYLVALGVGWHF